MSVSQDHLHNCLRGPWTHSKCPFFTQLSSCDKINAASIITIIQINWRTQGWSAGWSWCGDARLDLYWFLHKGRQGPILDSGHTDLHQSADSKIASTSSFLEPLIKCYTPLCKIQTYIYIWCVKHVPCEMKFYTNYE